MTARLPPRAVLVAVAAFIATAATIAIVLQPSQEDLEGVFSGGGALGPVIYSVAYAALTVAFIPGLPLTLAAGALYGAVGGAAVSVVGATVGATLAFLLARRGTRGSIEQVKGKRLAVIEERLSGKGLLALLTMRLIPVFPFNALNYAAGASSIGVRDYVIATFFGIIPGALAYSALGAGLDDPASPLFVGAAVLAIALALVARRLSQRLEPGAGESSQ
ncbi:MAG: TVP38/TMEM64 family protein [Actinomycetota bacterium]|nr:TVP38/TMEM64 family protein [Actinomycetota bacterium]